MSENYMNVKGINIYYVDEGSGFATILLHGWPTSSYLWRNIYPGLTGFGRVIVPDLPGYGKSDKPVNVSYSLSNQAERFDMFLSQLNLEKINLVVHDIGGTIGLLWAVRNSKKINKLVITDTIIFPELSGILFSMKLLIYFASVPFINKILVSDFMIKEIIKLGVYRKLKQSVEIIENYLAPFADSQAKKVFLKSLSDYDKNDCLEIINKSSQLEMPIKIICGDKDYMMKKEMLRIKNLFPHSDFDLMQNAGHFLQEDQPKKLTEALVKFLYT